MLDGMGRTNQRSILSHEEHRTSFSSSMSYDGFSVLYTNLVSKSLVFRTDGIVYQSIPDMPGPTFWSIFAPASAIPEGEDADVMPLGMVTG
jgi:hypothetical protein